MTKKNYQGPERRKAPRLEYAVPLSYKVCKKKTVSQLLKGYTSNISHSGLSCNIKDKVKKNDLLWLSFDKSTLDIYGDLERRSFIYQNGIVGKVVRAKPKSDKTYEVGIQFLTREEKNLTHIYPKIYFLQKKQKFFIKEKEEEPVEEPQVTAQEPPEEEELEPRSPEQEEEEEI
jgi:c-di-GMP-binding flagellar brake protein YcgR